MALPTHVRVDRLSEVFEIGPKSFALLALDAEPTQAIVFVHGFGGSPTKTWARFPDLIPSLKHPWWSNADIFFIGYDSRRIDIPAASEELHNFLVRLVPQPPLSLFRY